MYTVLIADDEAAVCRGLEVIIPWGEYGFEVVGCVLNGNEAIKVLNTKNIDLLITDIKMPGMNGLELIKTVSKKHSHTRVVIISAYSDFQYAKHAIRYGVKEYISKPIDEMSIINILKDVKAEIDAESAKTDQLEERRKLLCNQLFLKIINGENNSEHIISEIASLGICLKGEYIYVSLVHTLDRNTFNSRCDSLIKKLESIVLNYCSGVVFKNDGKYICIVTAYDKTNLTGKNKLEYDIYNELNKQSIGKTVISTGNRIMSIVQVKASYDNATAAFHWALFYEKYGLVDFRDIDQNLSIDRKLIDDKIKEFKNAAAAGRKDSAVQIIKGIISDMIDMNYPVDYIYSIADRILIYLDELKGFKTKKSNAISGYSSENLYHLSGRELQQFLVGKCQDIDNINTTNINKRGNQLIDKVVEFTQNNFKQDISLKMLADTFYANHAYLGRLFFETTGVHFSDFLNDYRIKNAAELLETTDYKIYEVAYSVGYSDIDYFTKVFKDKMNMTPSKYRSILKKREVY